MKYDDLRLTFETLQENPANERARYHFCRAAIHELPEVFAEREALKQEVELLDVENEQLLQFYADCAPATPGQSLESNHMEVLKERDKLKTEVEQLRQSLTATQEGLDKALRQIVHNVCPTCDKHL